MPSLLQDFIFTLVGNKTKSTAMGHAIIQAVRPNTVIAPLMFGLGCLSISYFWLQMAVNVVEQSWIYCFL
jgi:hypothetical protein